MSQSTNVHKCFYDGAKIICFCKTQTIRLGGVNVSFTARKRIVLDY